MRMTVYGNNATCPEADGACSCFLIEAEGRRILLDMGNGSLAKLQKDVDLAALDLIVISHLHFDHFGDLFCAKYQLESRRACGEATMDTSAHAAPSGVGTGPSCAPTMCLSRMLLRTGCGSGWETRRWSLSARCIWSNPMAFG